MPTYSYACTACDHRFDAQQSFSDAALTECPECEGRLRKLFSSVGVVFKGSGFYRNDARAEKKKGTRARTTAGPSTEKTSSDTTTGTTTGTGTTTSASGTSTSTGGATSTPSTSTSTSTSTTAGAAAG
ncbi:FmdB family zinc ribbon protein [Cellulomonas bogoriensis]|uniref:FmdB family transcriptional regulator n=1 Tax=Cellulomonas bogoriensis 69B4 = DSM 16987 TaxID=1386082 RepID=A0A0A0BS61_9CELL|nr:FmdB family zinc ribbon protein [Cellulomonas bogoriensis]KGM10730.1 FmdB family transcriptional regulator [Cellulomonas bogoriensis 69B4 = DSM 16987]